MPDNAQLIFIAGSEEGRIVALDKPSLLMGRSPSAALKLLEQYASREHAEFTNVADGVEVQVLSDRGLDVAGKTYKKGKRLLLASGDVLKVGMQTELVFVAAGDDPSAVLTALAEAKAARNRRTAAKPPKPDKKALRQASRQAKQARKGEKLKLPPVQEAEPGQETLAPGRIEAAEQQRRRKRLMTGLGIWLGLVFIVFIALILFKKDKVNTAGNRPTALSAEQIEQALQQVNDEFGLDDTKARAWLAEANQHYTARTLPGARYQAIQAYNRYLRWSAKDRLDNPDDMRKYNQLLEELVGQIREAYDRGHGATTYERWGEARAAFESIRQMVPDSKNPIDQNVVRHLSYINQREAVTRKSGGRSPVGVPRGR